jgi:SNF2 family DNA or RNA helicase
MRSKSELRDYQVGLHPVLLDNPACLLALRMGMGKTATVLTAVQWMMKFEVAKVLIVAPLRVAQSTWPDEITEWKHLRSLTHTLIRAEDDDEDILRFKAKDRPKAKEAKKLRLMKEGTDVHIINREALPWLVRAFGKDWPYDMVVYDESSRLKRGKKRTPGGKNGPQLSEFGSLCSVRKYISRVVELSGTPSPNGIHDLWGQIYVLDGGVRLGRSRTAFERRWFDSSPYQKWTLTPKPTAHKEIMDAVRDVMFGLRSEDYLKLPPVHPIRRVVSMSKEEQREYRAFEKTLVSLAHDVSAVSAGVLSNKLLQYANGVVYREDKSIAHIHDHKLDELESILEEANGEPVLCAYSFRSDLARIKKRFKFAVAFEDEPDAVAKWNKKKYRLLVAHPASIGHGLNLQHGGNIAVWFGLTYSLELYEQFNARLARPGQTADRVFLYHIITEGTADEDAMDVLEGKSIVSDSVNDAIRLRLLKT